MWPSRMETTVSAKPARCGSWVAISQVCPDWWIKRLNSSSVCSAVDESRLPVGSSASTSSGPVTMALAIATRWRWSLDNWLGLWSR